MTGICSRSAARCRSRRGTRRRLVDRSRRANHASRWNSARSTATKGASGLDGVRHAVGRNDGVGVNRSSKGRDKKDCNCCREAHYVRLLISKHNLILHQPGCTARTNPRRDDACTIYIDVAQPRQRRHRPEAASLGKALPAPASLHHRASILIVTPELSWALGIPTSGACFSNNGISLPTTTRASLV